MVGWRQLPPVSSPVLGTLRLLPLPEYVTLVKWFYLRTSVSSSVIASWITDSAHCRVVGSSLYRHLICFFSSLHTTISLLQGKKLRFKCLRCFAKVKWLAGDKNKIRSLLTSSAVLFLWNPASLSCLWSTFWDGSLDSVRPEPCWEGKGKPHLRLLFAVGPAWKLSQLVVVFNVWPQNKTPHSFVDVSEPIPF